MMTYILAAIVFAGALAAWYFTKDTPVGRKVTFGAAIVVALVLLVLSFKGNIPFIGRIVDWFKDRMADSAINDLDKENEKLKKDKADGVKSAEELAAQSKALANKAQDYRSKVNAVDAILGKKIKEDKNTPNPANVAEEATPVLTGNADTDAEALLLELKKRNAARRGNV